MRRAAPADTSSDQAELAVERNRLLFEALPVAVGVAVVLAAILAVVQSAVVAPGAAAAWFILLSAISLARLVVARSHQQQAEDPATARAFERRFAWGAVAAGAAWGAAGFVLFPADVPHQVFLAFVVAGVSAGAVSSLAVSFLSLGGFLTAALVPLAVQLLVTPGDIPLAMGVMTVLFLIFLVASGRRIGRMLNDNVRLRLEEASREAETRRTAESLRTNLEALQRLHGITASGDRSLDEKIRGILELGVETFGVERGRVSRIEDDRHTVEHAAGEAPRRPLPGTIPLSDTYCAHVYAADGPVAFHRAGAQIGDDPAYRRWRLESYIGTPIRVDGERYGTLSFAGAEARPEPFTELHLALIRILAEWIGNEMARVDAASRLEESEERVRLLLQSVGEGIYGLDAEGRTTFVNPASVAILGFQPEEILGRRMHDLVHHSRVDGSPYPIELCPTRRTSEDGIPRTVSDEVLWTRYGRPVPVEYTTTPVHKGEQLVGTVVSFRDVTERKEYERRLTSTLAMQRAILDAANYSIIVTDIDGVIHTFSQGAERMLGYSEAEMVGRVTPEVIHDADEVAERARDLSEELGRTITPGFEALVGMARARGVADERRWTYVRKDGTRLPVLLSMTAVRDDAGNLLGYLAVAADLTEREKIDRLKNEFVSTVSHELRTPLTSIRGSLGLVAGGAAGDLPDRALELVRIAARNSERLILLINDILDMEKIESGKMDFSLTPQPVMPLVEQAAEANAAYAAEHGTRIVIRDRADGVRVNVDEHRFAQAMANLLSNAAKFSPPDRAVEIGVTRAGPAGAPGPAGVVRVAVTDHGPGIPEEFRPRIFQKFSQADSADDRRRGGTGLGLSITRALVERMGGRIDFETETGTGTTFTIELPLWASDAGADPVPARTPARTPPRDPAPPAEPRVLVCEPDAPAGDALEALLRHDGFQVLRASDASAARQIVAADPGAVDAVILDVDLLTGGGLDLVHWLRAGVRRPALPIIGLCASYDDGRLILGADVALADWLTKPVQPDELKAVLRRVLRRPGRAARILHVEDDQDLRRTVAAVVGDAAEFDQAGTLAEARGALRKRTYDLVLLDPGLPDGSGWELAAELRGLVPRPQVLIFSAQSVSPEERGRVAAALMKSRTSEAELLRTIRRLITDRADPPPNGPGPGSQ